ncbi:MAG: hypothetical protein ACRBN8_43945 [Nannocystales bacterium]
MNDSRDPLAQLIDADAALPGPDAPALDRAWSGIEQGLASGGPAPVLDTQPLLASPTGLGWAGLTIVALAVAAAVVAVAGVGPDPVVASPGLVPQLERPPRAPAPPEPAPDPVIAPDEPAASPTDPLTTPRAAPRTRPAKTKPKPEPQPKPSLADELALMRRLSQALSRGDNARASKLLRQHQREFPKGALLEERQAAAVRIACGRNEEGAGAKRAAFEARWPKSMHTAAIRNACEG